MKNETLKTYHERILQVQIHIQNHLDAPLELSSLAKQSGFASYHFHRIFRAMVGEPCHQYIRRLRLERAALKLRQTSLPILSIALDAGFESHESFSRAFKTMFGLSPSTFRKDPNATLNHANLLHSQSPQKGKTMKKEIRIIEHKPKKVAFIRHIGPYTEVGPTFTELGKWASKKGLFGPKTEMLGICYDDPKITPKEKLRYDACMTINQPIEPTGQIGMQTISGGPHAAISHVGPYEKLHETYDYLYGTWLPSSGKEPAEAPPFEQYMNNPQNTPPEKLHTEIFLPLKP